VEVEQLLADFGQLRMLRVVTRSRAQFGTRIVAQLAKQLAESATARRGLISVCTAGGMGVTAILEKA
jgi:hypothetical protein